MSNNIIIIAEQTDNIYKKATFEVLTQGRILVDAKGGELIAVAVGSGIEEASKILAEYGADRILLADNPGLKEYLTDAYTNVLADIIKEENPSAVLLGASAQGKDLAARLAARLRFPLSMDSVAVRMEDNSFIATRPMYGGKVLADLSLEDGIPMIALRPNSIVAQTNPRPIVMEKKEVDLGEVHLQFVEKNVAAGGNIDLLEADVVVAGGGGMNGPDFSLVEELASLLGGTVGASRTAVDEGWRSHAEQVGQTGKVVSPTLYIACGISGAIQHLAGMMSSKVIVAINQDSEAPIFTKSDYGIVDDLFQVLPKLIEEIRKIQ